MNIITREVSAAFVRDFLAAYVPEEKRENAAKALTKVCEIFTIVSMQESSEEMTQTIFRELLPKSE